MKRAVVLTAIAILVSSCSLFEKPKITQEQMDALQNEKAAVEAELINLKQDYELLKIQADECAAMLTQQTMKPEAKGNYLVIAGSFKNSDNADSYSKTVKQAGGEGVIVQGPYDFKLVAFSTHSSLRDAVNSMYSVRNGISPDAWVYMQR